MCPHEPVGVCLSVCTCGLMLLWVFDNHQDIEWITQTKNTLLKQFILFVSTCFTLKINDKWIIYNSLFIIIKHTNKLNKGNWYDWHFGLTATSSRRLHSKTALSPENTVNGELRWQKLLNKYLFLIHKWMRWKNRVCLSDVCFVYVCMCVLCVCVPPTFFLPHYLGLAPWSWGCILASFLCPWEMKKGIYQHTYNISQYKLEGENNTAEEWCMTNSSFYWSLHTPLLVHNISLLLFFLSQH